MTVKHYPTRTYPLSHTSSHPTHVLHTPIQSHPHLPGTHPLSVGHTHSSTPLSHSALHTLLHLIILCTRPPTHTSLNFPPYLGQLQVLLIDVLQSSLVWASHLPPLVLELQARVNPGPSGAEDVGGVVWQSQARLPRKQQCVICRMESIRRGEERRGEDSNWGRRSISNSRCANRFPCTVSLGCNTRHDSVIY